MDGFSNEFLPLKKILDGTSLRHQVIVNNLANSNTPNFRRSDVKFSEYIQKAMDAQDRKGIEELRPEVVPGEGNIQANGNNVDLDTEVSLLSRNALMYRTFLHLLSMKINLLRTAITRNR